jgi:hypothetical protein
MEAQVEALVKLKEVAMKTELGMEGQTDLQVV